MKELLNKFLTFEQLNDLLKKGADVTVHDRGYNALHAVTEMTVDMQEKARLLLATNINVNGQDKRGSFHNTPLHVLIINEQHDNAVFLIEEAGSRIDFTIPDSQGKTSLIMAAKINSTAITLALVEAIGNTPTIINQQDNDGMTALHYACLYGNQTIVEALLAKNASMTITNKEGKTPLDCTALGEQKVRQTLASVEINSDRDEKALHNEFKDRYFQPLMIITSKGSVAPFDVPATDQYKQKALEILACPLVDSRVLMTNSKLAALSDAEKDYIRQNINAITGTTLITTLMKNVAQLKENILSKGYYSGWLLRMEAAMGNQNTVNQLLVNMGSHDINEFGLPSKRTALHQAALKGHQDVCQLLLAKGADVNAVDVQEATVLHLAILNKHFELAKMLVGSGASLSLKDKKGNNALSLLTNLKENQLKQELITLQRGFEKPQQNNEEDLSVQALMI